ncbi:hypothetical protein BGZ95_007317 [Linnemannia exigua]|uniref:Myb-like, SWIRM and MPN domain-containing protein 1 n=1 Tax=Linnemannia exigua TaxID=604196 RepID=A0AAD4DF92_9FUNG|nr:hypothetical protein BGZ95_007317 [Linnemannia exigua]
MPPKKAPTSKTTKKQKLNDSSSLDTTTDRVLSKEEEEEMSSALIAQLLAQEGGGDGNGYYAEYNNDVHYGGFGGGGGGRGGRRDDDFDDFSDEDEDYRNDYNYKPKSKSKRGAGRKKAKPAPAPVAKPKPTPKSTPKSASAGAALTTATTTITTTTIAAETTAATATETTISTASNTTETVAVVSSGETSAAATEAASSSTNVGEMKSDTAAAPPPTPEVVTPAAAPKVNKPKEAPQGFNTGVYSEKEERAFVEALDIFGRNWRSVEQHVATRDANSIRSHAQKHFIKLFRDNIPLPAKVLESGPGYTLSGNDLNPYSSAARPYLTQRMLDDPTLLPTQGGTVFTPDSTAAIKAEKAQAKEKKAVASDAKEAKENSKEAKEALKEAMRELKELKIRKAAKAHKESSRTRQDSPDEPAYTGRTDYSKARLRSARDRSSISYRQMASDLDPLTMVKCEPFCGLPNSGVVGCQPFGITVQSNVLLGMDFHAHLMTSEIIGFLAGEWVPSTRTINVKAIFPCRSLPTEHNHINVEMDPTSEFEVRQEIEKRNMRIVGWYHSHPTFTPDPSLVDIENQTSYQSLFKDDVMNEEPFVGAIVGPYDERLPGLSSVINWFYISQSLQERGHPKRLVYDLIEDQSLPEEESSLWVKLFDEYRDSPERTNFKEQWRQEENETKLQKMLVSLGRRMPWLRNSLLKNQAEQEAAEEDGSQSKSVVAEPEPVPVPTKESAEQISDTSAAVAAVTSVEAELPDTVGAKSDVKDLEVLPVVSIEEMKVDDEVIDVGALASPSSLLDISSSSGGESMEGVESTIPQSEKVESEDVLVDSQSEPVSDDGDKDDSLDVGDADLLETHSQGQGQGMERSLSNTSHVSAASASSSSSSSSGLSSSSATSSSRHSQGSSKAWAAATFGGLINDPFLALVEQELSGWESVVG